MALFVVGLVTTSPHVLPLQLGVKALTYNDLIQAQKEISAHNQQLKEQTKQLEKDNGELRNQSLQLVGVSMLYLSDRCGI